MLLPEVIPEVLWLETFLLAKNLLGFLGDQRAFDIAFHERAAGVLCPPDHSEEAVNPFEDVAAKMTPRLCALEIHPPWVALFRLRLLVVEGVDSEHPPDCLFLRLEVFWWLRWCQRL